MSVPIYYQPATHDPRTVTADLCVYGGVSGGVIAAVEAARRGLDVILLEPSDHVGGMTASGLGMTDVGNKNVIGGLSRAFYERVGRHYGIPIEWRFEPHVAEQIYRQWLAEQGVRVLHRQFVSRVHKDGSRITELHTVSGLTVRARIFIDASYEGDLMACAGVSHTVGREANATYGETANGQQLHDKHQFMHPVDPYLTPGVPASGLLPGIENTPYQQGSGDRRVQAYNFRMCLTQRLDIRLPFPKPQAYDPRQYILLKRHLATGWNEVLEECNSVRNGKADMNNHGAVSTDFIGQNHAYPQADYATRQAIYQAHVNWQQGLMWCLANDPEIPADIQEQVRQWGLCADEFTDTGGWPHQLYVRESRRMIGQTVMTEHHCRGEQIAEDPIAMAAYCMDSHNCRRIVVDGVVRNEGDVQAGGILPYPISYGAIVPRRDECSNLLVVFCLSASHIAFGSIRMEPVLMVLGQSAGIAADIALSEGVAVQDVPYSALERELRGAGQILERPADAKPYIVGVTVTDPLAPIPEVHADRRPQLQLHTRPSSSQRTPTHAAEGDSVSSPTR